jgi:hypothetical protein
MLNNRQIKYPDNDESQPKILDYISQESENKFRYEHDRRFDDGSKINVGGAFEYARYTNKTYRAFFSNGVLNPINYDSKLYLFSWGVFGQYGRKFFNEKLNLSFGIRADANSYSSSMSNLFNQISPRFSGSYEVSNDFYLNFNLGRFYQQPPYTMLGYRLMDGSLVNKDNNLKYIQADHIVGGIEWIPNNKSRITLEGFFKNYKNYPLSIADNISLASKGADFGTFGDEEVVSTAKGQTYGMEVLYRSRDLLGFNTILAYTLVWSNSENTIPTISGDWLPTAWDNRHIFTLTATRSFKKDWDFGFKWRFVGGSPYTPWDLETSSLIAAYNTQGRGFLDYSKFNTERLNAFHQLDVRVDKMFYFKKWTLNFYVDIQNAYGFKGQQPDNIIVQVDEMGNRKIDPNNPSKYLLETIPGTGSGTVLPTIGIILEF